MPKDEKDRNIGNGAGADIADYSGPKRIDLITAKDIICVPIDKLIPAARRVRRASKQQIERLKLSISAFACVQPALIRSSFEIIDGHIVVEALRQLGSPLVPCIVVEHLSDTEIRQLVLTLNRTQETGSWDDDALSIEFEELLTLEVDLEVTGFEIPEIDFHLGNFSIEENDDGDGDNWNSVTKDATPAVTRSGDIWIAGPHRIVCGRAQALSSSAAALGFGPSTTLIADPPFNVPVTGHVSTVPGRHPEFAEAVGEMEPETFIDFLTECLAPSINMLVPGGVGFIFMDWRHVRELSEAFLRLGVEVINMAVWVKSAPGMGTLYRSRHERVFVIRRQGAASRNNVQLGRFGRNRSNVWEYGGATSGNTAEDDFSVHPTVKPVCMIRDAILDVTAPGELVVDCFLGSGSTLIAAETSQRRCFGTEIEPHYVDVALRRWMALTGQEALHAATGESFTALSKQRSVKLLPAPTYGGGDV